MEIDFLEKRVDQIYKNNPDVEFLKPVVVEIEKNLVTEGKLNISRNFLKLMFLHPLSSRQFQKSMAQTVTSYFRAVEAQDPTLVMERAFVLSMDFRSGILVSESLEQTAAYDSQRPKIKVGEEANISNQTKRFVAVHTHPPLPTEKILVPSVIAELPSGDIRGDLYIFSFVRAFQQITSSVESGTFIRRPLQVILQQDLDESAVKILLIRENQALEELELEKYTEMLRDNQDKISKSKDQQSVLSALRSMGYNVGFLSLPIEEFYSYPMIHNPALIAEFVQDINSE
jgi:hypothetical protein